MKTGNRIVHVFCAYMMIFHADMYAITKHKVKNSKIKNQRSILNDLKEQHSYWQEIHRTSYVTGKAARQFRIDDAAQDAAMVDIQKRITQDNLIYRSILADRLQEDSENQSAGAPAA